jgi:beta-phosphoglucomutase family hydrolase
MVKAAIWDLDGTLVDSSDCHWVAWQHALAAEGHTVTWDQFVNTFGMRNDLLLQEWLGPAVSADTARRIGEEKDRQFREALKAQGVQPLPGVLEWLARLQADGWRLAIGTSSPRANLDASLAASGLGRYFATTVSADDVSHGKPDPEIFLLAAARLGADPQRSVVVEDAPTGIEAARRAGMRSIGVSALHTLAAADLCVTSLEDLSPDAFDGLIR